MVQLKSKKFKKMTKKPTKQKNARETDKEVVRIYSVILLSHKNEGHWVICRDMDGPRDCNRE